MPKRPASIDVIRRRSPNNRNNNFNRNKNINISKPIVRLPPQKKKSINTAKLPSDNNIYTKEPTYIYI